MATSANYIWSILNASDEDQTSSVLGDSGEVKECEPCQKIGNTTDATKYCTDCSEYLCGKCSASHTMFKAFQFHALKDVNRAHCEPCQIGGKRTKNAVKYCTDCLENMCKKCSKFHVRFKAFQHHVIKDMEVVSPVKTKSSTEMISKSTNMIFKLHISHDEAQQRSAFANSSLGAIRKVTARLVARTKITKSIVDYGGLTVVQRFCVVRDRHKKSLKVVDTRNARVTSEVDLSEEVRDFAAFTSVNDDQVAVTAYTRNTKKILFLYVSSSGIISKPHHSIDVEFCCFVYSIKFCKDRFYATTVGRGIDVINMQGHTIAKIDIEGNGMGIAVSSDHNTIYVCDGNTVFSLDLNGKVKAAYKYENLEDPRDVTVDGEGYVYVVCVGTMSVHRLSADLSVGQVIITDVSARSCAFNKFDNRLYLGKDSGINVYVVDVSV